MIRQRLKHETALQLNPRREGGVGKRNSCLASASILTALLFACRSSLVRVIANGIS